MKKVGQPPIKAHQCFYCHCHFKSKHMTDTETKENCTLNNHFLQCVSWCMQLLKIHLFNTLLYKALLFKVTQLQNKNTLYILLLSTTLQFAEIFFTSYKVYLQIHISHSFSNISLHLHVGTVSLSKSHFHYAAGSVPSTGTLKVLLCIHGSHFVTCGI